MNSCEPMGSSTGSPHGRRSDMSSEQEANAILRDFARESGRSVWVEAHVGAQTWVGGIEPDVTRPAASLLKLPLAMAAERHIPQHQVPIRALVTEADGSTILAVLDSERTLGWEELIGLLISASDGPSGRYLLEQVGLAAVHQEIAKAGCTQTTAEPMGAHPLAGVTSAREAVALLRRAHDPTTYPVTAHALEHSITNSRIPFGVTDDDIVIAHKTGTLRGVANDVAHLSGPRGEVWVAFLCEEQHDLLVTGYEMGLCTRRLLELWGLTISRSVSAFGSGARVTR